MNKIQELVEKLSNLTLPEASLLAKTLRETWGITDTVHPILAPADRVVKMVEEVSLYGSLILKGVGANKVAVIKALREVRNLGLAEAKKLSETPDAVIVESLTAHDARAMVEKLKAAGAEVQFEVAS